MEFEFVSASSDLYQNLDLESMLGQPASLLSHSSPAQNHCFPVKADISPASTTARQQPSPGGVFADPKSDFRVATNAWNADSDKHKVFQYPPSSTEVNRQQCVKKWIDNAVELSNYSRDNSPDTFIAATSISDSRDDVFYTDSEQLNSLEMRKKALLAAPEPPPRQKTHNYHNIDPQWNINHVHCPDNELTAAVSGNALVIDGKPPRTPSQNPWQTVTPPKRPPKATSATKSSPRKNVNKPPIVTSRKNFYIADDAKDSRSFPDALRGITVGSGSSDNVRPDEKSTLSAQIDFRHRSGFGMQAKTFAGSQNNFEPSTHGSKFASGHNVSATGRSRSESRTAATNSGGGLQIASASKTNNQVVNYSIMDGSCVKSGMNSVLSQKLAQVAKAEKALVTYSLVSELSFLLQQQFRSSR